MTNKHPTIGQGHHEPTFTEQIATDVDALARQIRAALALKRDDRQHGRYSAPALDLSAGNPAVTLSPVQARAVLRAIAPLALTTGKSALRVGRLSTEIADFLTALAACGRGAAGNPLDLPTALDAGIRLSTSLNQALDELRWKQATTAASVAWKRPQEQSETSRDMPISAVLRQSTAKKPAQKRNTRATVAAPQPSLLLPIPGGKAKPAAARKPEAAAATPPPLRSTKAA